jgi:DNA-binding protein
MNNTIKSNEADGGRSTVYIGRQKPFMNYVLATLTCLNNSPNVILKARGAAISLAVDVAEVAVKRFGADRIKVADVKIDTEQMISQEGGNRNVSTIEIELTTTPVDQGVKD